MPKTVAFGYRCDRGVATISATGAADRACAGLGDGDLLVVSLAEPHRRSGLPGEATIRVSYGSSGSVRFDGPQRSLTFAPESPEVWTRFVRGRLPALADLLTLETTAAVAENVFWIEPSDRSGHCWFIGVRFGRKEGEGLLVERAVDDDAAGELLDRYRRMDMRRYAREAYAFLTSEHGCRLPETFPLLRTDDRWVGGSRSLIVRADATRPWAFLMPVDHFARYPGYGGFSQQDHVDWLTSGRTFLQTAVDRVAIARELRDPTRVLRRSVFIINHDYPHFVSGLPQCERESLRDSLRAATELVTEVLETLQEIDCDCPEGPVSARYLINPPAECVEATLRDRQRVRYLFANFHVAQGRWVTCAPAERRPGTIDPGVFGPGTLRHLRLVHAYHCESAGDPRRPLDGPSICSRLLRAGVGRVSGSPVQEDLFDYFCSLLTLFCHEEGMWPLLWAKCLETGRDARRLVDRVSEFLQEQQYPPLCTGAFPF
ncbi:MAG: hypothetical protein HQ567_07845 [Candidatus Nealsonbacteria bacterium]|nr:hypothetical protein [Candidatus Nealsonbacteria bacterium]